MAELKFYKTPDEEYNCLLDLYSRPFCSISSKESYEKAGEKMLKFIKHNVPSKKLNVTFYISGLELGSIENIKEEELNKIKKSLDSFIEENKLNMKLEVKE